MSQASQFPDDQDPDATSDTWFELRGRFEPLEAALAKIGIYNPALVPIAVPGIPGGMALHVSALVGDVAFTDRVQDPEFREVDIEAERILHDVATDSWLDERERVRRNVEAGRAPFDDGE